MATGQTRLCRDSVIEGNYSADTISRELLHKYPRFGFHGTETAKIGKKIDPRTPTFVVDALDGTTNFEAEIPFAAVSIALMYGGEAKVGVVGEIQSGRLFSAAYGENAFLIESPSSTDKESRQRLMIGSCKSTSSALIGLDWPNHTDLSRRRVIRDTFEYFQEKCQNIRVLGSAALSLCYVAMGSPKGLDAYINIQLHDCQVAAASVILLEAGAKLTDEHGHPWQPRGETHGIVAANPGLHDQLAPTFEALVRTHLSPG